MSQSRWSLSDARNKFAAVVDAASKGVPQTVTRRGKPVIVVLSAQSYERLSGNRLSGSQPRRSFVEHLLAMPQSDVDFEFERLDLTPRDIEF